MCHCASSRDQESACGAQRDSDGRRRKTVPRPTTRSCVDEVRYWIGFVAKRLSSQAQQREFCDA